MNNRLANIKQLMSLGLEANEARVYLALLDKKLTMLEISRQSGVNRSTAYRAVEALERYGLVNRASDAFSTKISAAPPENLEKLVVEAEIRSEKLRAAFPSILAGLNLADNPKPVLEIRQFTGRDGLKQMLWNELRTAGEIQIFSNYATLNVLVGRKFADKFRLELIQRNIQQRSLTNASSMDTKNYSDYAEQYHQTVYHERYISPDILPIGQELTIHDDIVSIYMLDGHAVNGVEIHDHAFTGLMRSIFEHYWQLTSPTAV